MDINRDIFKQKFESLPQELRRFLLSRRYMRAIADIAAAHSLESDNEAAVELTTTALLMGLITKDRFDAELQAQGIAADKSAAIASEAAAAIVDKVNDLAYMPDLEDEEVAPEELAVKKINEEKVIGALSALDDKLAGAEGIAAPNETNPLPVRPAGEPAPGVEPPKTEPRSTYGPGEDPYREPLK